MTLDRVSALADRIRGEVAKAIVGQSDTLNLMLVALFSGGHVLLEGPPGTAKTLLAQCFAQHQSQIRTHPVHARSDAGRHHRHQSV
jgi:MoxR-like ATPase